MLCFFEIDICARKVACRGSVVSNMQWSSSLKKGSIVSNMQWSSSLKKLTDIAANHCKHSVSKNKSHLMLT